MQPGSWRSLSGAARGEATLTTRLLELLLLALVGSAERRQADLEGALGQHDAMRSAEDPAAHAASEGPKD